MLHNAAFAALGLDWVYVALPVAPDQVGAALAGVRALGLEGLNVTMPHKTAVLPYLDRISGVAATLGAVNTVIRMGEELVGESTDGSGFLDALRLDEGFDPAGRSCLVVGAGGAARAVVLALASAGAASVVVVNRTRDRAEAAAVLAGGIGRVGVVEDVERVDLVVNATPLGMAGMAEAGIEPAPLGMAGAGAEPAPLGMAEAGIEPAPLGMAGAGDEPAPPGQLAVPVERLRPGQVLVDLVYHPRRTPLVEAAAAQGVTAVGGLGMLVHQAAHSFRLWTGQSAPLDAMRSAVAGPAARPILPELGQDSCNVSPHMA